MIVVNSLHVYDVSCRFQDHFVRDISYRRYVTASYMHGRSPAVQEDWHRIAAGSTCARCHTTVAQHAAAALAAGVFDTDTE